MKKHLYLLLSLLTLHPTLATQKVFNSLIIASTLALSPTTQQPTLDTQPPRNLHDLDEKHILNLILNNYLRKAKLNEHLPNELQRLIHTFFIHEWTIHGLHKDTGTTYDPHDFDISGIHKQTKTNLDPSGFKQNSDYKDVSPTTGKPTKYDLQGYNIDRWNKDGLHENGTKLNNQGFAQHVNHASIHLHTAIDNLDKQALTLLFKNPNINVNLQDNYGCTPLIYCAWKGDDALPLAQALLKRKDINVNLQDNDDYTPLIMCCQTGDDALQIAHALLEHKHINVNLQEEDGWTPLFWCAWKGDDALHIAQFLLKHKDINVNLQDNYGCTPLMLCSWKGDDALPLAQALLKRKDINVNLQDNDDYTPLIMCCQTGDDALQIAQALLGHQHINVNLQEEKGWTPLLVCCQTGDDALQIAQALLKHQHINVNLQNNDGWTPLIRCAYTGDDALHIAQELLKHQHINVNLQNNKGWTPLLVCCQTGDDALQIAQALLKRKDINVNLQTNKGWTPLDVIIYRIKKNKENYKYVQLWNHLVAEGGILNKRTTDYQNLNPNHFQEPQKSHVQAIKNNPPKNCIHRDTLYKAIEQGNTTLAQNLINNPYVDINAKTNDYTPLMLCAYKGDDALQIAQVLLKHKDINVDLQEKNGWTPLMMCCQKGQKSLQIAQALLGHKEINVNLENNNGWTPLDIIIYWIKQNKENYKYVQLWNHLVAEGGILNKRTTDYQNLNPNHFQEPQKTYVQAIKNNPPINIRFPHIYQKHNQLRKQLEKLQKTSTQQLDHKNNTISDLKDQTQRLTNQLATANQLKDKQQQTIQQQNETINNQKNIIQHKEEQIQYFINQLNTIDNQKNTIQHNNKDIRKQLEKFQKQILSSH